MKKFILFIPLICMLYACPTQIQTQQKPYEATWLELTETEAGYVVYNYQSLNSEEFVGPNSIVVRNDTLIDFFYAEAPYLMVFDEVQKSDADSTCLFPIGNYYRFKLVDKDKHIARWITYHGEEPEMRVMFDRLYVDSLYNPYPIVNYVWEDESMEDSDLPIAKVPITNLPVGVTNLMNISKIPIDWEHPEVMDDMFVREKDNKYGLDGWFEYGDVFDVGMAKFSRMKNQYDLLRYSVLEEPERLYFCKRLPPVVGTPSGDFEVLI